ncbi:hypothetical protein I3842_07G101200 [Carya illinoinensis]|uniref:peroxidase n=1 Tax=Carya illinoinensis TaxID=32201 RepID=A0A922EIX0_CARIL|nr:hypothetical protein I3842_07G101200 [Carya illinoinensis]
MKIETNIILLLVCIVVTGFLGVCQGGNLRKNFYKTTCPCAEKTIQDVTWKHVSSNPNLPAKLLRMHFHDCFVRGCDASILLNSTADNTAEKDSPPNQSLSGFDVIDDIKAEVEKKCKGVVSCADILSLAARDSVSFQFQKPMWEVLTGRRDGTVSLIADVLSNIPAPTFNFDQLKNSFARKNLTVHDLVVLSGGHTIGRGHCIGFTNRLYNFTGRGDQDPSLNPTYAEILKKKCPSPTDVITTVEMDPGSSLKFDSSYYEILLQNKGLFQSDAALVTIKRARNTIEELVSQTDFFTEFAQSMKRMGAIEVLTGTTGEIRKQCGKMN